MSTAGRPTFNAAIGAEPRNQSGNKLVAPSKLVSVRDLNAQTKLKFRQPGQGTKEEVKQRDLRYELEEKERRNAVKKEEDQLKIVDRTDDDEHDDEQELKLLESYKEERNAKFDSNLDADDSDSDSNDSDNENNVNKNKNSDDEDDEDEDDEQELMRELERIQKEREQQAKKEEEEQAKNREEQVLKGNPLLNGVTVATDFNVKKRWYDDTVFKNQSRGEVKQQKRFINDTIRNDFHKKFLFKYVQ